MTAPVLERKPLALLEKQSIPKITLSKEEDLPKALLWHRIELNCRMRTGYGSHYIPTTSHREYRAGDLFSVKVCRRTWITHKSGTRI
jgi:hypothetical protein